MEFLGAYLSPNNSISQGQDKLTKYFYFRPDIYDNPEADFENIIKVKQHENFPKRYDPLEEDASYAIENIEVSKRLTDEEVGSKNVSFVVTATYDLLKNILDRENTQGEGEGTSSGNSNVDVDEDGKEVTKDTPPWKERAEWTFTPTELTQPFTKAYNKLNQLKVDVVNTAGCRLLAETSRYRLEITYKKSYKDLVESYNDVNSPVLNEFDVSFPVDWTSEYPKKTLLLLPPSISVHYYKMEGEKDGETLLEPQIIPYYTYSIKMIFDPLGWDKELLNVGTFAKFTTNKPEQIYVATKITEDSVEGNIYTNAAGVLQGAKEAKEKGYDYTYEAMTDPVPLTSSGTIYEQAIGDPTNYPWLTLHFQQYETMDFSKFPFVNAEI